MSKKDQARERRRRIVAFGRNDDGQNIAEAAADAASRAAAAAIEAPELPNFRELATRDSFASSATFLQTFIQGATSKRGQVLRDYLEILLDRFGEHLLPFRLAVQARVIGEKDWNYARKLTAEDIAAFDKPSSRIVLAMLGVPHAPWTNLNRAERAALLLGKMCAEMRERGERTP
jgi:hypothetical protein